MSTKVGVYSNCTEHQSKITEFFLITGIKCHCQQDSSGNSAGTVTFQETVKHQRLLLLNSAFLCNCWGYWSTKMHAPTWAGPKQGHKKVGHKIQRVFFWKIRQDTALGPLKIKGASQCQRWSIHTPNVALGRGKSMCRQATEKLQREWNCWEQWTSGTSGLLYFLSPATALEQFCECRGLVCGLKFFNK